MIMQMLATLLSLALCGLSHYTYNECAFLALSSVSPVTHAVANTIKRVCIILATVLVFGNKLTTLGAIGSATAVAGTLGVTGATTLTGALNANGDVNVNSGKLTVSATNGNTAVGGTLSAGATTVDSAIVTGAGSGIGRATAAALCERGLEVYGVGRREGALRETATQIGGDNFHAVVADVATPEGRGAIADQLAAALVKEQEDPVDGGRVEIVWDVRQECT